MRLYLSSAGVGNHLDKLIQIVGGGRKVLYVNNAKDFLPKNVRDEHSAEKKEEFEGYGFNFQELDLRDYFEQSNQPDLKQALTGVDLLWVGGGNTFVLRRAFRQSGLDRLLPKLLGGDELAYGGSSAGSIILTKTLRGTEKGDDPYTVPSGYGAEIIWDGLGLIDIQLAVHVDSDWFEDEAQAMIGYYENNNLKYESLRDGEVYIVNGRQREKLR
ncbi:type 1 glutamine amidotransferase-like domain-containing protein [Candidatus Saccharibacteria bacterium]|jgi:dipeptidase E|nr:type 1 glutamine amidotransferase-like domain-containing protein [Candidatus Saccharibacteria bacterium]